LEATQAVDEGQAWSQSSGGLTVKLFSAAEVQVSQPQYRVSGKAPAGTVVTVNDEILLVDGSQAFSASVALTDGPNLIEVVASSPSGDEVNFLLVVTFDSQN
jgi:TRAP-type mannitol/chloroaromatic compound transport system permease large subunit